MSPLVPTNKYALLMKDQSTTIVNAATAPGVAKSQIFTVQENKDSNYVPIVLTILGTFTVCTINIQASNDGGASFNNYSAQDTNLDVNARKVLVIPDLVPGLVYQINVATFTGTSVTINANAA